MKFLKMLTLALVGAAALLAFLGAGSASATALCKTTPTLEGANKGECAEAWDWPKGTEIDADLIGNAILETTTGTELDKCTTGTVKAHTTNTGSTTETVEAKITEISWGTVATPCSKTTDTLKAGHIIIHAIEDTHKGTVTVTETEVTVKNVFGSCVYGTGGSLDIGTLNPSTPTEEHANISINTIVPKISGPVTCPEEARWTASYTVTQPKPLYIATGVY